LTISLVALYDASNALMSPLKLPSMLDSLLFEFSNYWDHQMSGSVVSNSATPQNPIPANQFYGYSLDPKGVAFGY
jgi:hypothetical protein